MVGRDGPDRNDIVEDFWQCVLGVSNTTGRFDPATTDTEGDTWTCDHKGRYDTPNHDERDGDDEPEIRSKLVAYVAESSAGAGDAKTAHVLDGTNTEITVGPGQNEVELYAFINDRSDNYLPGAKVTFHATSQLGSVSSSTVTVVAKSVNATVDSDEKIAIPWPKQTTINAVRQRNSDGTFNNPAKVSRQDDIGSDDAVALWTFSTLPGEEYRISVRVTADVVNIGTIMIARPDATPPRVRSARVYSRNLPAQPDIDGEWLHLQFNDSLDDRTAPPSNAFSVTRIDRYGRVTNLSGTGNVQFYGSTVVVKLPDNSVSHGDTFVVTYTKPSSGGRLQDWAGNAVETFSTTRVYNFVPRDASDTTRPTVIQAEVEMVRSSERALQRQTAIGTTLRLAFTEHLDNVDSPPPGSAFTATVTRPGSTATRKLRGIGTVRTGRNLVSQFTGEWIRAPNEIVEVDLEGRILKGETVTVAYTIPPQNPLKDLADNRVLNFSGRSATNTTLAPMPDNMKTRSTRGSGYPHDWVSVSFDEELFGQEVTEGAGRPAGSAFVVTSRYFGEDVIRRGTGTAAVSDRTVRVVLDGDISPSEFTLTYTKPSTGGTLRGKAGAEVGNFSLRMGGPTYSTVCSDAGEWQLSYDTDYPAPRVHSGIPCDMAKPAWRFNENPYGGVKIKPVYNKDNPAPPVNQPVKSVIYTAPDQPDHRVVLGADDNCYREERVDGQWQRSVSYGSSVNDDCRRASWNAYNRALVRPMVNPDGGTFPDGSPPAAAQSSMAAVNGNTLTLTFDQTLDATSKPAPSAFTITVNGTRRNVASDGVAIAGSTVTLTLTSAVTGVDTVTAGYTRPSTKPLKGANGFAVETFTNQAVTNNTPHTVLQSAAVNENTLTLTFDRTLDTASKPAPSAFTITVNGTRRNVASDGVAIAGSTVTVTLPSAVSVVDTVTADYTKPSTSRLQSGNGVPVETFTNQAVTNNTPGTIWSATLTAASSPGSDGCVGGVGLCSVQLSDDSFTHFGVTYRVNELVRYKKHFDAFGFVIRFDRALPAPQDWTLFVDGRPFRLADATLSDYNRRATWQNHGIEWTTGQLVSVSLSWKTPTILSATVDGTVLKMTFSENLDTASKPAPGDFYVTVNDARRNVATDGVAIAGTTVTLTLASAATDGDTVKVRYTKPSTNPLQGAAGNDVETFADRTVTNDSPFWSATLTAGPSGEGGNGCRTGSSTLCSTALTDDDFTLGGTDYHVEILATGVSSGGHGILDLQLDQVIPTDWTLFVDERAGLAVSTATRSNGNKTARWSNPGWGLGNDQVVSVRLKAPAGTSSDAEGASGLSAPDGEQVPAVSVTGVSVVSDPGEDQTYGIGDTISVQVTFNRLVVDVDTSGGTPRLKIDMDPAEWGEKWASYASGSGTASLTFAHTVVEPNISTQGIAVLENTLELNGGAIRSDGADAGLAHTGLAHDANHKVDWQAGSGPGGSSGDDDPPPPPANSPATGAPSITGTARVGETLTADTSAISDADGLTNASFSYQWLADGAAISGATGSTYTLASADVGKAVKVRLSFTDDAGHAETLTSAATASVAANPPEATGVAVTSDPGSDDTYALGDVIQISVTFDQAVDVDTSGGTPRLKIDMDPAEWGEKWASFQGGSGTKTLTFTHTVVEPNYSTQGIAVLANSLTVNGGDIESTATDTDADLSHDGLAHNSGHKVDWQTTGEESGPGGTSGDDDPPPPPANSPATGAPAITGTARVGETLTADTSGIADADGLTNASFSYQWLADGSGISGATGSTYAPASADVGKAVKVRVSFTDDAGHAETLTSAATAAVAANPPEVTAVAITSDPGSDGTYGLGDVITISVTFDEAVDVTGAPRIAIDMDPADWGTKQAAYQGGSGTKTLTFTHTVVEPNYSTQGIAVLANSLALNGGDIESKATDADANLSHDGLAHDSGHKVDWRLSDESPGS